jgi:hypothetical protein
MRNKKLKWIKKHTDAELDAAVNQAAAEFGERFWVLLHGIDAYMERRSRRVAAHEEKVRQRFRSEIEEELADPWGDS